MDFEKSTTVATAEVKPDCAPSGLLGALGFVRGTGFDGEVWTNPENIYLSQVWIHFSGDFQKWEAAYDARAGFDLGAFFKWWCEHSQEEDAFAQLGDER